MLIIYQGFVISDWQGIDRLTSPPHANYTYSVETSILAGVDMVRFFPLHQCQYSTNSDALCLGNVLVFKLNQEMPNWSFAGYGPI